MNDGVSHEEAQTDYAGAGLDGVLAPGTSPALIVVDPADAYVNPRCPLYAGVEHVAARFPALMDAARAAAIPVIVTRVEHDPSGRNGGVFARKVPAVKWFAPESPYSSYIDGLGPVDGDIEIVKQYPSAFAGTTLAAILTSLRVDTLIIAGFSTSGCIRATATDAMQNGFIPFVVEDAVGDRLAEVHEANLFDIKSKIGEVVPSTRALDVIRGEA